MARVKPLMEVLNGVTRFGRLTVIGGAPDIVAPSGFAAKAALVRCDCGVEKIVRARGLVVGHTASCGCLQRALTAVKIAERSRTHGQCGVSTRTSEWSIWSGMRQRCANPGVQSYPNYGGRGISVCERWANSFEAFFEDMGPKPSPTHSIERRDNNGNYEPGNCCWATPSEQANNRSSSRILDIDGKRQTVTEWAKESGTDTHLIFGRLNKGWGARKAVFTPAMRKGVARGTEHSRWRKTA